MIVWGGASAGRLLADGAAYDPEAGVWRAIASAPIRERSAHTAVWTGEEMIVWGGCCAREEYGDGAAYDPVEDSWRKLPAAPIDARTSHTAVWTGREMIVWGGHVFDREFADGAAYDPETDSWQKLPEASIQPRYSHAAVWTGKEMIVWGGATTRPSILSDGASLHRRWTAVEPAEPGRSAHSAVWTGGEMIVWGGCCAPGGTELAGGSAYDPAAGAWRVLPPDDPRAGRQSGVWWNTPIASAWSNESSRNGR